MDRKSIAKNQSRKKKATEHISKVLTKINKYTPDYTCSSEADPETKRLVEEMRLKFAIRTIKKEMDVLTKRKFETESELANVTITVDDRNALKARIFMITKKLQELKIAYSLAEIELQLFYVSGKDEHAEAELHEEYEKLLTQIDPLDTNLDTLMQNVGIGETSSDNGLTSLMHNVNIGDRMAEKRMIKKKNTRRCRRNKSRTRRRRNRK